MSTSYIPADLRRIVYGRAAGLCEYCLLHEDDTFFGCEVDHIISEKHGGPTLSDNLALACLTCNRNKGSDIATLSPRTGALLPLFHPRHDLWSDHFALSADGVTLIGRTETGEATLRLLGLNSAERLLERQALAIAGRYPGQAARKRMALSP